MALCTAEDACSKGQRLLEKTEVTYTPEAEHHFYLFVQESKT